MVEPKVAPDLSTGVPMAPVDRARRRGHILAIVAVLSILASLLLMFWISAVSPNLRQFALPGVHGGPPWWPHNSRPRYASFVFNNWLAVILGAIGVLAGLAAIRRGFRPRIGPLLGITVGVVALFTVLPPAGSTDSLNYAAYGRLAVLGVNPYVVTVRQFDKTSNDVVVHAAVNWATAVSVYGPLATGEQWLAAELGGDNVGHIVFWLKLWNALAFLSVALALDRLLRADPVRRARAHLIWSMNPLLLWAIVASGHVDGMAAAFGFFGLLVLRSADHNAIPAGRAFAAGLLTGIGTDFKASVALFILGAAWVLRSSLRGFLALAGGAALVLIPSFAPFGWTAVDAVLNRGGTVTWDNFYKLFYQPFGYYGRHLPGVSVVAGLLFVIVAIIALRYLPDGYPSLPAVRPAMALTLAFLFVWPFQRPWYDAIALCLLALYAASVLDWLVLLQFGVGLLALMPSISLAGISREPWPFRTFLQHWGGIPPAARLAALLAFVGLCWWIRRRQRRGGGELARTPRRLSPWPSH